MLKVIAGKFRGVQIKQPDSIKVRPTTHKIRESVFNMIQFNIKDSIVLDLFAGSGAYGIESISRGAMKVIFNDSSSKSMRCIKENLIKLKINNYDSFVLDYKELLSHKSGAKFDIIFLDPPYEESSYYETSLKLIKSLDLLESDGTIIIEKLSDITMIIPDNFIVNKQKKYGNKEIILLNHID